MESPEESEYQYVMRCIEIRQKVMLASNNSDIKYDKELARKLFYYTLQTELLSSYVIQEIYSLIRNNVSDEDLVAAVTKALVTEKERSLVQGNQHKKSVHVYDSFVDPIDQVKQKWIIRLVILALARLILSAVDILTKQVNRLMRELPGIKNDKRGDKLVELNIYVQIAITITQIIGLVM